MYDEDYFERGIQTGKSCYTNFRWMPELTIPMSMTMIDYLGIKRGESVLDYGCAKGYCVKAFNMLGRDAYGYDISEYALKNCPEETKDKIVGKNKLLNKMYNYFIAKDVFEHMDREDITSLLSKIRVDKKAFIIVPLGDDGVYRVPAYGLDKTHINAENEVWWTQLFNNSGWDVKDFRYLVSGIKDNWNRYAKGNGFFLLER